MSDHIQIFDTTLRDGEQTPGVSFSFDERLKIAIQLEKWGVDVIEAGFPASSEGSFKSVESIAKALTTSAVCGLARCKKSDIDAVHESTKEAQHRQIHLFLATSPIHLEYKLKMTEEQVLASITENVTYAKTLFEKVQFSPEDATRTPLPFLIKAVQTAVDAGADIINIPDTVGYSYPTEYGQIFKTLIETIKSDHEVIYSSHCHDDLGLAVANALSAFENGARRVEGAINGIGERAGNTALEEIALALHVRQDHYNLSTNINLAETKNTSDMVSRYSGLRVPRNKAIVGQNAFSHESGIHQDGILKNPETYEIMTPQLVGVVKNSLPLGKLSGKHAFSEKLVELGYNLSPDEQVEVFKQFKSVADKKKQVTDRDIHAILQGSEHEENAYYKVNALQLQFVSNGLQSAVVVIEDKEGNTYKDSSIGSGSITSIYNAIDRIFDYTPELQQYRIESITEGTDAQAEVHVQVEFEDEVYTGIGIDYDILYASCKAYVEAHAKHSENKLKEGVKS